jgi:hypothetical protein
MQCVLFVIANAADPDGVAFRWWRSDEHWWAYIAERTGMAKGSIYRTIGQLEGLGLLSREESLPFADRKAQPLVRLNLTKFVVLPRPRAKILPRASGGTGSSVSRSDPTVAGSNCSLYESKESKNPTATQRSRVPIFFRPEAVALVAAILDAVGMDRETMPPAWYDIHGRAQLWLDGGWNAEIILRTIGQMMGRPGAHVPRNPRYFEPAIADAHAQAAAPLPVGTVRPVHSESPKDRRNREWSDARATLDEAIARRRAARDGSGAPAHGVLPEWRRK